MNRIEPTPTSGVCECALVPCIENDNRNAALALGDLRTMAESVAASGLFAMKTPAQALALMLVCQANGEHPARACVTYSIIQGRPAMTAQAMLAKFQAAGGKLRWIERTDEAAEAELSHPAGGTLKVRWTLDDAKRIGLAGRENWKNYPRAMLSARVLSEGVRAILPGVILGFHCPEEIADPVPVFVPAFNDAPPHRELLPSRPGPAGVVQTGDALEAVHPLASPTPHEQAEKLAMLVGPYGAAADAVLQGKGWIQAGQCWRDLEPDKVKIVLSSAARFKKTLLGKTAEMEAAHG